MGNRAVITTVDKELGVYVHWNGDRSSVEAFLAYCKLQKFRCPEDDEYGWARLCQIICNFFGSGGLSCGIDLYERLDTDNGDNGVYIIRDWKIVDREFNNGRESREGEILDILRNINASQPNEMKLDDKELEDYVNSL